MLDKDKKRDKVKTLIREAVKDEIQSSISSVSDGIKEQLNTVLAGFKEEFSNSRKIQFDPAEAKAPFITTGQLGDKGGYSFIRIIQAQLSGDWKRAKVERGVHEELARYGYGQEVELGYWVTPLNCDGLPSSLGFAIRGMLKESLGDVEIKDVKKYISKVLGIQDDSLGGYLVEPTQSPEIIELLRPAVVVQRAGAQEIPLPVSGMLSIPKQTGGVATAWVGESENIKSRITTNAAFGQLLLIAKKLATFQQLSSELITSSTPAAEALIRKDMALAMAEKEDLTWLEGAGTQVTPLGMINNPNVTSFTASTTGGNGDTFNPQDVQISIATVEEQNAPMQAWIMRPKMLAVILTRRANQGTAGAGEFMWDIIKDPTNRTGYVLGGYPVFTTTQVSGVRVKAGGATNTYILLGTFSEALIGRKATLEIKASAEAGTAFETDQVWLRGITRSDFGLRHPAAIVFIDDLLQS